VLPEVRNMPTAIILSSVFIGLNNFFAGLVRSSVDGRRMRSIYLSWTLRLKVWSFTSFKTMIELSTRNWVLRVSKCTSADQERCEATDDFVDSFFGVIWWEWSRGSEQYYHLRFHPGDYESLTFVLRVHSVQLKKKRPVPDTANNQSNLQSSNPFFAFEGRAG
jgi:hypothetical protein